MYRRLETCQNDFCQFSMVLAIILLFFVAGFVFVVVSFYAYREIKRMRQDHESFKRKSADAIPKTKSNWPEVK